MGGILEKLGDFSQKFTSNFTVQIEKNELLKGQLNGMKSSVYNSPVISKAYKGLQFGDFLISKVTKEYPNKAIKPNKIDILIDRIITLPQYYGGNRDVNSVSLFDKICNSFDKYLSFPWYKDYKIIKKIENEIIPKILKKFVLYEKMENTTLEVEESLKQLKNSIFSQEYWTEKEIVVEDIRKVEIKNIFVKNLKKTVRAELEFTVLLSGYDNDKKRNLKQHFGASIEFIKENGYWVASSFSFSPFS